MAIERILEAFWTAMGRLKSEWFPLGTAAHQINEFVSGLDQSVKPFFDRANEILEEGVRAEKWTQEELENARQRLQDVSAKVTQLKDLAPGNQRAQLIVTATQSAITYLDQGFEDQRLQSAAAAATNAVDIVSSLAASFQDNPARRLISIYAGSAIGVIVALFLGLDLFQAALTGGTNPLQWKWQLPASLPLLGTNLTFAYGVVLTGLVMGLGSSPTHEIIKVVSEFKKNLKAERTA